MRQWQKALSNLSPQRTSSLRKLRRSRRILDGERAEDQSEVVETNAQRRLDVAGFDREVEFKPTKGFKYYRRGRPV